jgi:NhaA family Na+:H+ antiporter
MRGIRKLSYSPIACGLLLLGASVLGLTLANSPLSSTYFSILHTRLGVTFGSIDLKLSVEQWISEGLMVLFFLGVTLEIKREITLGHLNSLGHAALPAIGAVGGMIGPALVYIAITRHSPEAHSGWAIPAATDAAFTLPLVAALGTRIPPGVRAVLMAVAIFDDVLAIVVIAAFYSSNLSIPALVCAALGVIALLGLNRAGVRPFAPYVAVGLLLWVALLQSGVHATLAGVLLGLTIPAGSKREAKDGHLPLQRVEHCIQPYVALLVLPLFGLANVGVKLDGFSWDMLLAPAALGATAGLFFGKQLGIFSFVYAAIRLRIVHKPAGATYGTLYGVALLCGIGFTISLFIASLAFANTEMLAEAKAGIFFGSILSAAVGWTWIRLSTRPT